MNRKLSEFVTVQRSGSRRRGFRGMWPCHGSRCPVPGRFRLSPHKVYVPGPQIGTLIIDDAAILGRPCRGGRGQLIVMIVWWQASWQGDGVLPAPSLEWRNSRDSAMPQRRRRPEPEPDTESWTGIL